MNRRDLFCLIPGALACAALPAWAAPKSTPVPHVYLARIERDELRFYWIETWRHSTDPSWVQTLHVSDKDVFDGFPYEERHAFMNELYLWSRHR